MPRNTQTNASRWRHNAAVPLQVCCLRSTTRETHLSSGLRQRLRSGREARPSRSFFSCAASWYILFARNSWLLSCFLLMPSACHQRSYVSNETSRVYDVTTQLLALSTLETVSFWRAIKAMASHNFARFIVFWCLWLLSVAQTQHRSRLKSHKPTETKCQTSNKLMRKNGWK